MDKKSIKYDFTIIGGGLIGTLVSILLSRNGFKCCLIERNSCEEINNLKKFSPLSLNHRSILILKKFSLWNEEYISAAPITGLIMKCFNSLNRLQFSSSDIDLEYLGYVVNKFSLQKYFINAANKQEGLDIVDNSSVVEIKQKINQTSYVIRTSSEKPKSIQSEFVILSDGEPSSLKDKLEFKTHYHHHDQTSYLVDCGGSFEAGVAAQLFNEDGIFALVPYSTTKTSLILTLNDDRKDKYINKNNKVNIDQIQKVYSNYLKNIKTVKITGSYQLKSSKSDAIIRNNVLLLGNTSQLLHPVGAQGFNLGIRNIETIINQLDRKQILKRRDISESMKEIVDIINHDRQDVLQMTDVAIKFFANSKSASRIISSFMINFLKISQKSKHKFLKKILGLDNCSYLTIKG